ncbi:hypothetical protein DID88_009443 [Monilinia fructigena]|uniref:Uncharacterized protein n=1 Tax=Monilinia fructigena TaxID=38457 RepID=A0A395ILZ5_9HELO|nr:hypothetical protein DID88_009443 [Monilinia fructigena]
MHPSELPLPRNDPEYSTEWSTRGLDVNAPPLPITTTRNEEFDHCIDPHGSSRLSIVASTEDQGHGDQQVKVKIESNSPDYGLTTLPGPREPEGYNDSELQQHRNARDPFKTPHKPVLFYSPFQRSARRSEEHGRPRQLSNGLYQSIEGNDFNDDDDDEEPPPQLATEKLWNAMYKDDDIDDTQLKRDLRRLSEGAEDLKKNFRLLRTDSIVLER